MTDATMYRKETESRPSPSAVRHSYAVGHWEGDTLVVEVVGFNEGTWLDISGHPHTDAMRVTERYTPADLNTLEYEASIDDPKT